MENVESLLELYIEDIVEKEKIRIENFTEPLLIIEYFQERGKSEFFRKSLHQLLKITRYKNILVVSHYDLKDQLYNIREFFQDTRFFFGSKSQLYRPEFYRIYFYSQRKLQYYRILVDLGNFISIYRGRSIQFSSYFCHLLGLGIDNPIFSFISLIDSKLEGLLPILVH